MPIIPKQKEVKKHGSIWQASISDILFRGGRRSIPIAQLAVFCRKVDFLLGSGLSIKTALTVLQRQSLGAVLNKTLPRVYVHILKGDSFSIALEREEVFPEFMLGYVAIGEKTGQVALVFAKLADYYEQQSKTRKELTSALIYPISVILMMLGVIVLAMLTILPGYARIFEASDIALPAITEMLINASAFLTRNAFLLVSFTVLIVASSVVFAKSHQGKRVLAKVELSLPILRLGVNFHFAQALSLLLNSGVRVTEAIDLCIGLLNNVRIKRDLQKLSINLRKGNGFSASLEKIPYIDPLLRDLAYVGEETGELARTIEKCSHYFAATYAHSIGRLNKLVEPIITLAMGVLLALVMLAVVLPTFELATAM